MTGFSKAELNQSAACVRFTAQSLQRSRSLAANEVDAKRRESSGHLRGLGVARNSDNSCYADLMGGVSFGRSYRPVMCNGPFEDILICDFDRSLVSLET